MPSIAWGFRCLLYHRSKKIHSRLGRSGPEKVKPLNKVSCTYLKIKWDFADLHFSSRYFWTWAKRLLLLLCVVPVSLKVMRNHCYPVSEHLVDRKKEIKHGIHKSIRGMKALAGSSQRLRNTSCFLSDFLLAWRLYYLLFFFFFLLFLFARWDCAVESVWQLYCWAQRMKVVPGQYLQAANAKNLWNLRTQIGALWKFCRSSGGFSLKSSVKGNKVRAKEIKQPWNYSSLLFLFLGLETLPLHWVVFSLKGE